MQIDKVKYDGIYVTIVHHEGTKDNPTSETTMRSKDAPVPEFVNAFAALRQDVRSITELDVDISRLTVRGVSFSDTSDIMGATITSLYELRDTDAPLILNTPHKSEEPYSEGGDDSKCLAPETCERLETLRQCAMDYVLGTRAQISMFENQK